MKAISCFHCGLPVTNDNFRIEIAGKLEPMCCPGCRAAAQAIHACGLDQYYQFRTALNENPEQISQDQKHRFKLYDREEVKKDFVFETNDEVTLIKLFVEGITCAACVWLIEKRLNQLESVVSATVNLTNHSAQIRFNHNDIEISELFSIIHELGYVPRPYRRDAQHEHLSKTRKDFLTRIGIAGIGMMQVMMNAVAIYIGTIEWHHENLLRWASLVLTLPVIFYSAVPFFKAALRDLQTRHLTMDVPVSLAIIAAFIASCLATFTQSGEVFFESVVMFTFFLLVGRFLEFQARQKAHSSNENLLDLLPVTVHRVTSEQTEEVSISDVKVDDVIQIMPGETIAIDGKVVNGTSSVNESSLTGEFEPVRKTKGDAVRTGSINADGLLQVKVNAVGPDSSLSIMMKLLDRSAAEKPAIVGLADKIASYFVALVLLLTIATFSYWHLVGSEEAFWIALSVLVVTCPCALSLATPVALATATTTLKRIGVLPTRGFAINALAKATDVIFDKTGTLTNGHFDFVKTELETDEYALVLAASLQQFSEHPIAKAFTRKVPKPHLITVVDAEVTQGMGVRGTINHIEYRIGSAEFCSSNLSPPDTNLWVCLYNCSEQKVIQWFQLEDLIRTDASLALTSLTELGLVNHMLTGDRSNKAQSTAEQLGLTQYQAGQKPEDKVSYVSHLQSQGSKVLMLGDGINDAPVLAKADVSVAMANGTELAKHSSDILLLNNHLERVPMAVKLSRKAYRIVAQNLSWALMYNLSALPLAMAGLITPWMAAIGMSLSSLLVVLNALRLNKKEV